MAEHGTETMYRYGCRCDACREAHYIRHKTTTYHTRMGTSDRYVDATAARERLRQLAAEGMTGREASNFGIEERTWWRISSGETQRIRVSTEAKIMAISGRRMHPRQRVDAGPTARLVRWWRSNGVAYAEMSRVTGVPQATIAAIGRGDRKFVRAETAKALREHTDELRDLYMRRGGTRRRTSRSASRKG